MSKRTYDSLLGASLTYHLRTAQQCVGPDKLRPERLPVEVETAEQIVSDFQSVLARTNPPSFLMSAAAATLANVRSLKKLVEVSSPASQIFSQVSTALSSAETLQSLARETIIE